MILPGHMRRRQFITLLGGAAAWPIGVHAQQAAIPVVGFVSSRSPDESADLVAAFLQGLSEAGFVEGQNLIIAFRWAEGRYDRLPALAADLVRLRVALIFAAGGALPALAAKAATSTIPIVFSAVTDPIRLGLVSSLERPGGNVTGMGMFSLAFGGKRLELLHELRPTAAVIGYLLNPSSPSAEIEAKEALDAASALGIQLHILNASTEQELDAAFTALANLRAGGLVVQGEPFFDSQRDRLVALSAQHGFVASYAWREYVVAGGLMSYGTSITDSYRRGGIYAGRVLKGEKPSELPVMQPTRFQLVLNLRTATTLGLQFPPKLLAIADEVIE
jgi:putative tryptophan/tyrosine transport system substrate-binding protein